jgi:hypothetical protein
VILKDKMGDANKMPKGGKRLLREALGLFRASQGQDAWRWQDAKREQKAPQWSIAVGSFRASQGKDVWRWWDAKRR